MGKKFKLFRDIGIDLGTATVVVYAEDLGVVMREPSVVVIDKATDKVIKVGREAQEMLGRTPDSIEAMRPLKDGTILEYEVTEKMLQYFIRRASASSLFPPRVMISVPSGISDVEQRAILEAAREAGAKKTFLIESPIAAALGAGLDINSAIGNMTVDIGGGVTEVAVISLGGIVVSKTVKLGGDSFDEAIVEYVRDNYNLIIGERTAEGIKIKIGEVYEHKEAKTVEVKGRDVVTGLPKVITLSSKEMIGAMYEPMTSLMDAICDVIEHTPPELVGDILHNGIVLVGGGSLLGGLDKLIHRVTGIKTLRANEPDSCVVLGTGEKLKTLSKF
ncbi:MAG: rod shape-determining protein [Ruminococcaceae bacterium]|nr:rod shape-determining protein [Oscillospiraceae bacterium]